MPFFDPSTSAGEQLNELLLRHIRAATASARAEIERAIGQVVYEWNDLHEGLGRLFVRVAEVDYHVGMAIWHSIQSDRAQREILQAAILASPDDERWAKGYPTARVDLRWLLSQANSLSDRRNDAIHSPFELTGRGIIQIEVSPAHRSGNPRAKKLKDKDLLEEFSWYAATAEALTQFAAHAHNAIYYRDSEHPWPDRPRLPSRGRSRDREA